MLTVGDGNFTYSCVLAQTGRYAVTATTYEASPTGPNDNVVATLASVGAKVFFGVDCGELPDGAFDRVIFNFPVALGRAGDRRQRALLRRFFGAASGRLAPGGEVWVTLESGQGERWDAADAAAEGGLLLLRRESAAVSSAKIFLILILTQGRTITYVVRIPELEKSSS